MVGDPDKQDESEIDFSKVKNFFKKFGKEKSDPQPSDEVSFDFSKIKSWFKSKGDGDASVDWKSVGVFLFKYQLLLLLIIPIFIAADLRLMTTYLPITDSWAQSTVDNSLRSQLEPSLRKQIDQQFPNLPQANKEKTISDNYDKFIAEHKTEYDQQVEQTSKYFKEYFQDENFHTYLLEIDPFFWKYHAENVLVNGHPGHSIRDNIPWDDLMLAPDGRESEDSLHPYLIAYVYRFVHFFNRNVDLARVEFFFPVIISALAVIPAFFIGRKVGGNVGGLVASVIVAMNPAFLTRTPAGFSDTDAYNILFPLMVTWVFFEAFDAKTKLRSIILASISGVLLGIYSFTWVGWFYIFDFLLAVMVLYIPIYLLTHRKEIAINIKNIWQVPAINHSIVIGVVFLVSTVLVTLFLSGPQVLRLIYETIKFTKIKEVAIDSVWPNVFTTVAEQNTASLTDIVNHIGGKFFFWLAIFGIIASLTKRDKFGKVDWKYPLLITLWLFSTMYASTKGIRFTLLMVPAFGIGIGFACGVAYKFLSKYIEQEMHVAKWIVRPMLIIIVVALLVGPYKDARATAAQLMPNINDAWYNSLTEVKEKTPADTIITSWWDFGHWFKSVANRRVTFDGTSQDTPQAHWVGNALLSPDELVSRGILQMLDCSGRWSGTGAFDYLMNITNDHPRTIDQLYEMLVLNKEDAAALLKDKYDYSSEQIQTLLGYSHCSPPPAIFITSEDMVGKAGVWGHFGSWDFNRALIYNRLKSDEYNERAKAIAWLQQRFNYSQIEAENIFVEVQSITDSGTANSWISGWPNFQSSIITCPITATTAKCSIQTAQGVIPLEISSLDFDVRIPAADGTVKRPSKISYPTPKEIKSREYSDGIGIGMILWPDGDSIKAVLADPKQVDSVFTKLFFFNGHGLKYFDAFSDTSSPVGNRILMWSVDWDGKTPIIRDEFLLPKSGDLYQIVFGNETAANATAKLVTGMTFGDFARSVSIDNATGVNGGFVQKIRLADVQPVVRVPLEEVAFGVPTNPIKIGDNWFIFKFENVHEIPYGAPADYEESGNVSG